MPWLCHDITQSSWNKIKAAGPDERSCASPSFPPLFQKYPTCKSCPCQLKGRAPRHSRHSPTEQGQEQTHQEGLLATPGERRGGNCCQLVCVHSGWHFQPCNCCIMNLAMEFKSYESFRPRKHESAPEESGDVKITYI